MTGATEHRLPPAPVIHAALVETTERLAHELARPTDSAPEWSQFEWRVARAVAAMHGVSPLLAAGLRWRGPCGFGQFLDEQRTHTGHRHVRIEALLRDLDRRARERGIALVALKGAALHAAGVYRAGERPMADLDILVRPRDSAGMIDILRAHGYIETRFALRDREFSPAHRRIPDELGEHADNDIKIELHDHISEALPVSETDISEAIFPQNPLPGLNPYPSTAALMMHLLLHASGAMAYQSLRLLHLNDIAMLSLRMKETDWEATRALGGGSWWAFPPLRMTERYYPGHIPPPVLAASAQRCPALLNGAFRNRRLSAASLSFLWVNAFPGIEWSRSIAEMVRYAASRIRPAEDIVKARAQAANTEAWAFQGDWLRVSQGRRILRWVFSKPIRPRTLHAVRIAVARAR